MYGFVGAIATALLLALYLFWVLSPRELVRRVGLPEDPYWGLVAPAFLLLIVSTYATIYGAVSLLLNPDVSSFTTLTDGHARRLTMADLGGAARGRGSTPEVGDLPIGVVNRRLQRAVREGSILHL